MERFGPNEAGEVFITIFNDGKEERTAIVTVDASLARGKTAAELVSGQAIPALARSNGSVSVAIALRPEECGVLSLTGRGNE